MIVLQYEDTRAARDRQELRRRGNAVADRGNQGDIARVGMDQAGRGRPRALVLGGGETIVDCPGRALAPDRGACGLLRSQRQRAIGGGVQVANMGRNLEERALRRKHFERYRCWTYVRLFRSPIPAAPATSPPVCSARYASGICSQLPVFDA